MKKINKKSLFLFTFFSGMTGAVCAATDKGAAVYPDAGPAQQINIGAIVVIILIIVGLIKLFKKDGRSNGIVKIKPEDAPRIKDIVDKICANSRCIDEGLHWSRSEGPWKSNEELAKTKGALNLTNILSRDDIDRIKDLGGDETLLTNAAQAFCFHSINRQVGQDTWCDEVTTVVGDNAVDTICDNQSLLASYILFRIAIAKPITIKLSACLGRTDYTFDFKKRAKKARRELEKRGFGGRDPLETIA